MEAMVRLGKHSKRKSSTGRKLAAFWLPTPHFTLHGIQRVDAKQAKAVLG